MRGLEPPRASQTGVGRSGQVAGPVFTPSFREAAPDGSPERFGGVCSRSVPSSAAYSRSTSSTPYTARRRTPRSVADDRVAELPIRLVGLEAAGVVAVGQFERERVTHVCPFPGPGGEAILFLGRVDEGLHRRQSSSGASDTAAGARRILTAPDPAARPESPTRRPPLNRLAAIRTPRR